MAKDGTAEETATDGTAARNSIQSARECAHEWLMNVLPRCLCTVVSMYSPHVDMASQDVYISHLAALPDGRLASADTHTNVSTIYVWDADLSHCRELGQTHREVFALAVLSCGQRLVSGHYGGAIVWDVTSGEKIRLFGYECRVCALAAPPFGVAFGGSDTLVYISNPNYGILGFAGVLPNRRLEGHSDWVTALAPLPGHCLASGSWDKTVRIWDRDRKTCLRVLNNEGAVWCMTVLRDGSLAVGADDAVRIWDTSTGECVHTLAFGSRSVAAFGRGLVAVAHPDRKMLVWDGRSTVRPLGGFVAQSVVSLPNGTLGWSDENTVRAIRNTEFKTL
jgi:WD40 repeat protein